MGNKQQQRITCVGSSSLVTSSTCNCKIAGSSLTSTSHCITTISNVISNQILLISLQALTFRYRWAFVGDDLSHVTTQNHQDTPTFTPHVTRIASLMDQKFTDTQIETLPTKQNELLLTMNSINQLKDLHGFFKTLSLCSNRHRTECTGAVSSDYNLHEKQVDKKLNVILERIDKVIEMDFLDKIPR